MMRCRVWVWRVLLVGLWVLSVVPWAGAQGDVEGDPAFGAGVGWRDGGLRVPGVGLWRLLDSVAGDTLQVGSAYWYRGGAGALRGPWEGRGMRLWRAEAYGAVDGRVSTWGLARYEKGAVFGRWGSLMAHPELFYPYVLTDTSVRRVDHEAYTLSGYMGVPLPLGMGLGLGGSFTGGSHYGKADPRPRSRVGDLRFCATWSVGGGLVLEGRFRRYSEVLNVRIERERRADMFYRLLGHGLYDRMASETKSNLGQENYLYGWEGAAQWHWGGHVVVFGAYRGQRGHGEGMQVSRLSEVGQRDWEVGVLAMGAAWGWDWEGEVSYLDVRRVGTEIYYDTVSVSRTPRILEYQEFARVPKWLGVERSLRWSLGGASRGGALRVRYQGQYGRLGSWHVDPSVSLGAGVQWHEVLVGYGVGVVRGMWVELGARGALRLVSSAVLEGRGGEGISNRLYEGLCDRLFLPYWLGSPSLGVRVGEGLLGRGALTLSLSYTRGQGLDGGAGEDAWHAGLRFDM